jgi:hypothetical protein
MGTGFTYQGASGERYNFVLVDTEWPKTLPWQGAVIVFAEYTPKPLGIFASENLYGTFANTRLWHEAQEKYGALLVYVLISNDAKRREAIVEDLVEEYQPQMNVQRDV